MALYTLKTGVFTVYIRSVQVEKVRRRWREVVECSNRPDEFRSGEETSEISADKLIRTRHGHTYSDIG